MNDYYQDTGNPAPSSGGSSALVRAELALIEAGFDKLPALTGNAGKMVVVNGAGTALTVSALILPGAGTLATLAGAETFSNKRNTWRIVGLADAVAITPTIDNADEFTHVNTQALGNLTVNAPTGTPTDGQRLVVRIKSTNAHAFIFNAAYRASLDMPFPAALSGAGKTDYLGFIFNAADAKWDLITLLRGYT